MMSSRSLPSPASMSVRPPGAPSRLLDYISLTKPEVTFLVLIATALGCVMGSRGAVDLILMLNAVFGTALLAAGTATLNHYLEREHDGKMRRTAGRPLPAGRLTAPQVFWFGILLSLGGVVYLIWSVNLLTSLIGALTLLSYLLVYTPLKRKTTLCTLIGAFPGAAPVLMGWSAVREGLSLEAWVLYSILFVWQFPHFLAIAWMYREDYARAGMLMLPRNDGNGRLTFRQILLFAFVLVPLSLLPVLLKMTGLIYLIAALVLGSIFFFYAYRAAVLRTKLQAKVLLHASVLYLPLMYAVMVLDR
ncbi:MAG: heme o synthase [Acidobacteriota bacterium]